MDSGGHWTLRGPRLGAPLADLRYAVVDVETSGGPYRRGHRITEVAIYEVCAGMVADEYRTLVNPGRDIPPRIAALTGITDNMVSSAPSFDQIAGDVLQRIRGRVLVAHNARFDWGFLSQQLAEAIGEVPRVERLCTVSMARRILPRLRHRDLDALARHFGIEIMARHRAFGDALATARVLIRLLDEAGNQGLTDLESLNSFLRKRRRPSRPRQGQQLSLLRPVPTASGERA